MGNTPHSGCDADSVADWIAAMVERHRDKKLTPAEARVQRALALREYIDVLAEIERDGGAFLDLEPREVAASANTESTANNAIYIKAPLGDAIVAYLETCKKPQTAKQILDALVAAGREFESSSPLGSIKWALKKTMLKNDNLFHVTYGKWHLRTKVGRAALGKLLAKNAGFGRGGRSRAEHVQRTKDGMEAARASGKRIGAAVKMTPELVERAKAMVMQGMPVRQVGRELGISPPCLYSHGINKSKLKNGVESSVPADGLQLRLVK